MSCCATLQCPPRTGEAGRLLCDCDLCVSGYTHHPAGAARLNHLSGTSVHHVEVPPRRGKRTRPICTKQSRYERALHRQSPTLDLAPLSSRRTTIVASLSPALASVVKGPGGKRTSAGTSLPYADRAATTTIVIYPARDLEIEPSISARLHAGRGSLRPTLPSYGHAADTPVVSLALPTFRMPYRVQPPALLRPMRGCASVA